MQSEQEILPPIKKPGFQPGHPRYGGRQPGGGKHIKLLRELILTAAELEGNDGEGREGILGYLRKIAKEDMRMFAMLLGRVLPLQVETKTDFRETTTYRDVEDVRADLEARGISIEAIRRVMYQPVEEPDGQT